MYYKERTEFGTLSISSEPTVDDDPLDELCRSAEIDRREPVRPAASQSFCSQTAKLRVRLRDAGVGGKCIGHW